jgi:hypothetical protein
MHLQQAVTGFDAGSAPPGEWQIAMASLKPSRWSRQTLESPESLLAWQEIACDGRTVKHLASFTPQR